MGDTATQDQAAYDEAYRRETERLEAEAAAANGANTETPVIKQEEPKDEPAPVAKPDPSEDRLAKLEAQLASATKALNDTKRWAQESNIRAKRLEQEREAERRAANKPAILADNPGLEEAIQHVTGVPSDREDPMAREAKWANAVMTALPDLDALLEHNPDLRTKAAGLRQEFGEAWMDPLVAIRELGKLQVEHVRNGVAAAAAAQARQDFEKAKQKQTAMSVPGGGTASRPPANPADDPKRYETMSSADFQKERAKVLGYS